MREAKIKRIRALQCTHFIDDLPEELFAPAFPENVRRFLFQQESHVEEESFKQENIFTNWIEIKNAIFTQGN